MCNEDLIDSMKEVIAGLIAHTGELRNKFNEVEEEHREGNLDGESLSELNKVIHMLETDSAAFEKILGE
jgi:chromosome condensin MukBEF ATPase and DNA-binding subunit MukB